jgi:hypothetical protein
MWNVFKKKPKTKAEIRLAQIEQILFPPLTTESTPHGEMFHVDYSIDSNLHGALVDLENGCNDKVVHDAISYSIKKLIEARKLLNSIPVINKNAKAIIVDIQKDETDITAIED